MALTQTYVDPSINANSGTGTIGDPYGDLQYALDTMTRDATNGDQINIKSGTAEVLTGTLDLTSYGTPTNSAQIVFRGYSSAANDGGVGIIDGNGGNFRIAYILYSVWRDLELRNTGTSDLLVGNNLYTEVIDCICHGSTSANGALWRVNAFGCYVYDCTYGITESNVFGCGFFDGSVRGFSRAIASCPYVINSVVNTASIAYSGINAGRQIIIGNSFIAGHSEYHGLSAIGSSYGKIIGNLVESPNGIQASFPNVYANAVYSSGTAYSGTFHFDDNETLSASPFEKTGAATWANAKAYFAPSNVGLVRTGSFESIEGHKGAIGVQQSSGGGGATVHPLYAN